MKSHVKLRRTAVACVILLLLVACVAPGFLRRPKLGQVINPETGYAFPAASEIAGTRVINHGKVLDLEDFEAPVRDWPQILAALSPSR